METARNAFLVVVGLAAGIAGGWAGTMFAYKQGQKGSLPGAILAAVEVLPTVLAQGNQMLAMVNDMNITAKGRQTSKSEVK